MPDISILCLAEGFMIFFYRSFIFIIFGFTLTTSCLGDTPYYFQLPNSVIHAKRIQTSDQTSHIVTIIPLEDTQKVTEVMTDLLKKNAGISVTQFGSEGHFSTVSLRGSSASQVLILLDGIPLQSSLGVTDLSLIPLNQIDHIELIRGAVSSEYGSAAFGGAINLVTKPLLNSAMSQTVLSMRLGSFQTLNFLLQTEYLLLENPLYFTFNKFYSEGNYSFWNDLGTQSNSNDDFEDRMKNNQVDQTQASFKIKFPAFCSSQFYFDTYQAKKGAPGMIGRTSDSAYTTQSLYHLKYQALCPFLIADGCVKTDLFGDSEKLSFYDLEGNFIGSPQVSQQDYQTIGIQGEWIYDRLTDSVIKVKSRFSQNRLWDSELGDPCRNSAELFLSIENQSISSLTLFGNTLFSYYSDEKLKASYHLGILYAFMPHLFFKTNLGNSFRIPTFSEKYSRYAQFMPNPNLEAETVSEWDMSVLYQTPSLNIDIGYFKRTIENLIEIGVVSGVWVKPMNLGRAQIDGVECSWQYRWDYLKLQGSFTKYRGIDQTEDANRYGKDLVGLPDYQLFARIDVPFPYQVTFFQEYYFSAAQKMSPDSSKYLPFRESVTIGYEWGADSSLKVIGQIRNVFNRLNVDRYGFPLPGREVSVSFIYQF